MNYTEEQQFAGWNYTTQRYDDSGCWEDYISADDYEDELDRRLFERSNPYGV